MLTCLDRLADVLSSPREYSTRDQTYGDAHTNICSACLKAVESWCHYSTLGEFIPQINDCTTEIIASDIESKSHFVNF